MHNLVALIQEVAGGELVGCNDSYASRPEKTVVTITSERISKMLGAPYADTDVRDVFERLGLPFEVEDGIFKVSPPFERTDILISEDLIEEVGRIIGYDRVPSTELSSGKDATFPDSIRVIESIKDQLVSCGFNEISTYAMLEKGDLELMKPLADDKRYLRSDLALGHRKASELNARSLPLFNLNDVRLFEIGHIWPEGEEKVVLGVTYWSDEKDAEKKREELFQEVTKKLSLLLGVSVEGVLFGSTLQFDMSLLLKGANAPEVAYGPSRQGMYVPFSMYPFALRDVAVWTPVGTTEETVQTIVKNAAGDLLYRVDLFDRFEKESRISYAFSLVLQASDRTLTDVELESLMKKVHDALESNEGFTVR
jgi:phenylalanyl-tRNA synthetase beta chain